MANENIANSCGKWTCRRHNSETTMEHNMVVMHRIMYVHFLMPLSLSSILFVFGRFFVQFISIKLNCHRFGEVDPLTHIASQLAGSAATHTHAHGTQQTKQKRTTQQNGFEFDIITERARACVCGIWYECTVFSSQLVCLFWRRFACMHGVIRCYCFCCCHCYACFTQLKTHYNG